jgi:hypothetical protein
MPGFEKRTYDYEYTIKKPDCIRDSCHGLRMA